MSLLTAITSASTQVALAGSRALSRITDVTYAEAGSSLAKVTAQAVQDAGVAVNQSTSAPVVNGYIDSLRKKAIELAPSQAAGINSAAAAAETAAEASFNAATATNPAMDVNSVSTAAFTAATSGQSNFISAVSGVVGPTGVSTLTNLATANRVDLTNALNTSAATGFTAAGASVSKSLGNMSVDLANKVMAKNKAAEEAAAAAKAAETDAKPGLAAYAASVNANKGLFSGSTTELPNQAITDVNYQEVKLYVEGVQLPFSDISITSGMGQFPTASIIVPPQASLLDIARFYQPKVHIFYTDNNYGGDRLLFWGHIIAVNYSKSKGAATGNIIFEAVHKNALLEQLTLEWSGLGYGNVQGTPSNSNPENSIVQLTAFNSISSIIETLQGTTGLSTDPKDKLSTTNANILQADTSKIDAKFANFEQRLIGMPGCVMGLWNQLKRQAYNNTSYNKILSLVYIPLIEDGIAFFDRLSGHYILEKQIEDSREQDCVSGSQRPASTKHDILLPPSARVGLKSAVQIDLALGAIQQSIGFSNEFVSFHRLFVNFYESIEYQLMVLNSPAEVPANPTRKVNPDDLAAWNAEPKVAIETVIKPLMPFYYSPICNVILPNMLEDINVSQMESVVPTRVTSVNAQDAQNLNTTQGLTQNYRAPHSIREAVAIGANLQNSDTSGQLSLKNTLSGPYGVPGKYELGRGIIHKKLTLPFRLSVFSKKQIQNPAQSLAERPARGTREYQMLENIHFAWIDRYGYKSTVIDGETRTVRDNFVDGLDPFNPKADVLPHQRLLFAASDYDFSKENAASRSGSATCIFNPYIVPGYPMDIVQSNPTEPSFHAMCVSVSHFIGASGIKTHVGFTSAMTFNELSLYFIQPIHPWMQEALKMINVARSATGTADSFDLQQPDVDKLQKFTDDVQVDLQSGEVTTPPSDFVSTLAGLDSDPAYTTNAGAITDVQQTLINNPRAKTVADEFYRSVLGVGAAAPDQVFNYEDGTPSPIQRQAGMWYSGSFSHGFHDGYEANLNLSGAGNLRLIARPIESKESIAKKFNYKFIDLTQQNYNPTFIFYENNLVSNKKLLEPGASPFLDYPEVSEFLSLRTAP